MKILVTGATGFIGKYLIEHLVKLHSTEVFGITRSSYTPTLDCKYHYQDLRDRVHLPELVNWIDPDIIVHLAANPNSQDNPETRYSIIDDNILGTHNLLSSSISRKRRFILASSIVVYGNRELRCVESMEPNPTSIYGATKLACEGFLQALHSQGKIEGRILRLPAIVGKGQTHGALPHIIKKVKSDNEILELIGNAPGTKKPYMHISDAISGIHRFIFDDHLRDSVIYNIAPNTETSIYRMTSFVQAQLKTNKSLQWSGELWDGDNPRLHVSNYKVQTELGWKPKFNSDEAVYHSIGEMI